MTEPRPRPDLGIAMTTMNNLRTIERALASVESMAARIVVVDSGSTDGTIECCRARGAEVIHRDWDGPVPQKQFAIDQCREHRWILLLDSDESLEPELQDSVRQAMERNDSAYTGWCINRKVWFMDGWLHHAFQPEWRLRLFRGGAGRVVGIGPEGRGGHDRIEVEGRVGRLRGDCRHDSWADLREMCDRSTALAHRSGEYAPRGGTPLHILVSPPAALIKQLLIKRGILDGWRGWVAAGAVASGVMQKHLFIAQRRARHREDRS